MLGKKLQGNSAAIFTGLLIFFVPFFSYLSPENLRWLSKYDILEILLSLIIILYLIFISSYSVEKLMKRFFRKKIILFPLLCFAFYLNFLYVPFSEFVVEFFGIKSTTPPSFFASTIPIFIFFEFCCLAIIVFGAKFYNFSIRMIFIFSTLMLINACIPLAGYLTENIGKESTISFEIENSSIAQEEIQIKRNVYYIILDAMMSAENAAELNIATKNESIGGLSDIGLKYIDKSQSSYSGTFLTLASIVLIDYHQKPDSPRFLDYNNFYPGMMYKKDIELPLISYLEKANSSFIWSGNIKGICIPSNKWSCVNSTNDFFTRNLFKFYLTTVLPKIHQRLHRYTESQDSIDKFLTYIDKNGLPKTPFFAFLHHLSPHGPYLVTDECEPTNDFKGDSIEGYKSSYQCALKKVKIFMEKINSIDPEAIVIFQADHGPSWSSLNIKVTEKEEKKLQLGGRIYNAIKAPEICFDKYGLPKTNVNTVRFALNCAYGFQFPYRENIHYESFNPLGPDGKTNPHFGTVVEKNIYE